MQVRNSLGSSVWRTALPCASRWNHSGWACTASSQLRSGLMRAITCMPRFLGRAELSQKKAVAEELAFSVVRHLRLVKRQNAGDAHHHGVNLQAGPVVRPLLDVEHRRVVFGHIGLAEPADFPLPGNSRLGGE